MKNVVIIAAIGRNNELGKDNKLIWHLPEDLNFFKEQTIDKSIVMGINTFNSLSQMLSRRNHLVLTHQELESKDNLLVFHTMEELLDYISMEEQEVMIIGGAKIYNQFLQYADKMILTKIDSVADADTFFPKYNKDDWIEEELSSHQYNDIKYKHLVYRRK